MAGLGHSKKTKIPGAWFMWGRTGHDCLGLGQAWGTLGCETEKSKEIEVNVALRKSWVIKSFVSIMYFLIH